MADKDPLEIRRALMQGKNLSTWGVYGLLALMLGNLVGASAIFFRQSGSASASGVFGVDYETGRMLLWIGMAVIAAICAFAAWRRRSRVAILIGLFLVAIEWADWALGFSGRVRLTVFGLGAYAGSTTMLVVGLWGAFRYHRLSKIESQAAVEVQR